MRFYLSPENIASFHARFLTTQSIALETGQHLNSVLAALKAVGVKRFTPDGKDYGPIYLRTDAPRVLTRLQQPTVMASHL